MIPYIANTAEEVKSMLKTIGVNSLDDLFSDIKPQHRAKSFDLPAGKSEFEVDAHLRKLAAKNRTDIALFIGGGFYDHYVPAAVGSIISRGEFYTAYTPYQPECSQGTLQALYEYQSMMCTLTGMDVSNASLYDGGTALYEAIMMAVRITERHKIIVDAGVNPIYRKMLRSYLRHLHFELVEIDSQDYHSDQNALKNAIDDQTAGIIIQNPNFFGTIDDYTELAATAHAKGALVIQSVYPVALGLIKTPGEMDVDIVVGEGQSLGLSLNFGGPYLGFMTAKQKYIRKMPGRIVGQTVDKQGRRCFVNTLQAREQHIRREKATSNICTNVSLCALQAVVFMTMLGREGFKQLAQLNLDKTEFTKREVEKIPGVKVNRQLTNFNEFVVTLPASANQVIAAMLPKGFAAGFPLSRYYKGMDNQMLIAVTEKRTKEEILAYVNALKEVITHLPTMAKV